MGVRMSEDRVTARTRMAMRLRLEGSERAATALLVRSAVPGCKDSEMGECSEDSEDSGGESSEE